MGGLGVKFQHFPLTLRSSLQISHYHVSVITLIYVAAKATYIRLLHGKIGFLDFFRP